jgi:hypothetical protein
MILEPQYDAVAFAVDGGSVEPTDEAILTQAVVRTA